MAKVKRRLTRQEEFEIMKLVFDKFLWAGFAIMGVGFYKMFSEPDMTAGASWMVAGVLLLVVFVVFIVREYEIIRINK